MTRLVSPLAIAPARRSPTPIPAVCPGWGCAEGVALTAVLSAEVKSSPEIPVLSEADAPHPADAPMSLYEYAFREAERYKWLESERRGYDVGDGAIREWYAARWPHFCRTCQLQHVAGRVRWKEFDPALFASLHEAIASGDLLADRILDRIDAGWENLTILLWAREWGLPMKAVLTILERIDVNRARLDPDRL